MASQHECRSGVRAELTATREQKSNSDSSRSSAPAATESGGFSSLPLFCRRDDYIFLPPEALGGLPCLSVPEDQSFDPYALALRMAAQRQPPDLRIGMNPARGMVNVPTWFWVEGYDGGTLSQSETVRQDHQICHTTPDRGPDGLAVLGPDLQPRSHTECTTDTTTFIVDVRLWPADFTWDFGDSHAQDVPCAGPDACGGALGLPYVDPFHKSTIRHPYLFSSLGVNGSLDAYTVGLAITFSADYRVSINGVDQGGWHSLPSRTLSWSATHQVQEAQAVLTRPCPVTVPAC